MVSEEDSRIKELTDKIVIATTTWYNPDLEGDNLRAKITKNSIKRATDLEYQVMIVDGGSSDELLKYFETCGAKVFSQTNKGMGTGRRQVIKEAYNTNREIIAWTEPEKEDYIPEIIKTAVPIIEDIADLVVPKRKSLKSYPLEQQYAEKLGNLFWKELTGYDLDMWSGPRTWKREFSNYFLDYMGEYGDKWDSIFIPVIDVILDGKKVLSVEVNYTHPKEQAELEEHDLIFFMKRIEQLTELTKALETHWKKRR
ncbi:MAG: hypothetical protein ISS23_00680 [Nanoarchaeota archaeon]|nr:hypothetical protein [Nanoarchaeota archaeon]